MAHESFWTLSGDALIRNTVRLNLLAGRALTLDGMSETIVNAPQSKDEGRQDRWPSLPVFGELMLAARQAAQESEQIETYRRLENYWLNNFAGLVPETRTPVTFQFSAMVDALNDPRTYELVSTYTNITPISAFGGRIIILNIPVSEYGDGARILQAAWKYAFMRAALRRPDWSWGDQMRPVFLWEDEGHATLIPFDQEAQAVMREYRVARVLLTQNLPNLYDRYGGGMEAQSKVDSFLANLSTRIFHCNGCPITNTWASQLFDSVEKTVEESTVTPTTYPGLDPLRNYLYRFMKRPVTTQSYRKVREPLIHPHDFLKLSPGGPDHGFVTEALISKVGRIFNDGHPCRKVAFRQILL